jgi:hypothetical protein
MCISTETLFLFVGSNSGGKYLSLREIGDGNNNVQLGYSILLKEHRTDFFNICCSIMLTFYPSEDTARRWQLFGT